MKKLLCVALAAVICMSVFMVGCVQNTGAKPDSKKGIRWITSDYSMRFTPDEDCKGTYKFNGKKYNIRFVFSANSVNVVDTDKNNAQLFLADWKYEDKNLYIYNITFNTGAYKEMDKNYMEFIYLHPEKLK